jgi:hypothetical protein
MIPMRLSIQFLDRISSISIISCDNSKLGTVPVSTAHCTWYMVLPSNPLMVTRVLLAEPDIWVRFLVVVIIVLLVVIFIALVVAVPTRIQLVIWVWCRAIYSRKRWCRYIDLIVVIIVMMMDNDEAGCGTCIEFWLTLLTMVSMIVACLRYSLYCNTSSWIHDEEDDDDDLSQLIG